MSWAGKFMNGDEHVINMSGEVHINDTLMWGYERGGSYVSCSHLRTATSGEVWSRVLDYGLGGPWSWTTSGEVRRDRTTSGHICGSMYILGPRSNVGMVCME